MLYQNLKMRYYLQFIIFRMNLTSMMTTLFYDNKIFQYLTTLGVLPFS